MISLSVLFSCTNLSDLAHQDLKYFSFVLATIDSSFQVKIRCFYLLLMLLHCKLQGKMCLDFDSSLYLSLYHRMTNILAAYVYTSLM